MDRLISSSGISFYSSTNSKHWVIIDIFNYASESANSSFNSSDGRKSITNLFGVLGGALIFPSLTFFENISNAVAKAYVRRRAVALESVTTA